MSEKMHYFSAVEGRAFRRPGTPSFIGATRTATGFKFNTEAVVAIPETEMLPYRKDYNSAVKYGDLKRRTKADYDAWQKLRTERSKKRADDRKKEVAKATKAAAAEAKDSEASAAEE